MRKNLAASRETMSPRERWQAVLAGSKPDRVPMDYWGTTEAGAKLVRHLGVGSLDEALSRLHVDRPFHVAPSYAGPTLPAGTDEFGCTTQVIDYGAGVYHEADNYPLVKYDSVAEIEANYTWPSPDWYDYTSLPKQIEGKEHRPIMGGSCEAFFAYCRLRGQEQAMMDLVLSPEIVHYCLDKIFNLAYENIRRTHETIPGKVLLTYVSEDLGSQEGLLFSIDCMRTFLKPGMQRLIDLVHSAGGGCILAPCHNIQPVGPVENTVAMYEEGLAAGRT